MSVEIPFINAFSRLPEATFARVLPTPVSSPSLIAFNYPLADSLGIRIEHEAALAEVFSGNEIPANADPLAMAYSGHQFGHLNPQLGDGRAILLGDVRDSTGSLRDIQLKGSGRTPFSRGGDGRSPLGPAMREYIMCEAMHALGVPTTRALAVVHSGEPVIRERREPGAVFTRVASSHIRVGTFQYFALRRDYDTLAKVADHVIERHYADIPLDADDRYLELFRRITQRQAQLISQWMLLGFIHGVMNTDNMTVSGDTIDYGPCAFMDGFSRNKVFSSIDQQGRYAYQNQPAIGQWNLARLAETMLELFPGNEDDAVQAATEILNEYSDWHQQAWEAGMMKKLGLPDVVSGDREMADQLITLLDEGRTDYTLFFRTLGECTARPDERQSLYQLMNNGSTGATPAWVRRMDEWLDHWQNLLSERTDAKVAREQMRSVNPAVIPRNHRVAEAIAAAEEGDYQVFEQLMKVLAAPYSQQAEASAYAHPPQPQEQVLRTFCGT